MTDKSYVLPGFTAERSLRRSRRTYRTMCSAPSRVGSNPRVVPAYMPGPATQARCNDCLSGCAEQLAWCSAGAAALVAGCFFPPACAGAILAAAAAQAGCDANSVGCIARCSATRCCPKRCGAPNPLEPGSGCCDSNEQCVSQSDPNGRHGCCPAGQSVCGGSCCAPGERCCGDTCCPPGWFCINNVCTQYPSFGEYTPAPPTHIPPVAANGACPPGHTRCRNQCCPPGMTCCAYGCEWGSCIN
jgi:hypothetical protein